MQSREKLSAEQKVLNTQQKLIHPMQYLFLMLAATDLYSGRLSALTMSLLTSFYFEKAFQWSYRRLSFRLPDGEKLANDMDFHMPKNYSFLTKIGQKVNSLVGTAASGIVHSVETIDREMKKRFC